METTVLSWGGRRRGGSGRRRQEEGGCDLLLFKCGEVASPAWHSQLGQTINRKEIQKQRAEEWG